MKKHRVVLAMALALVSGLAGCRGAGKPEEQGRSSAEAFLATIRDGRIEEAWNSTSVEFKSIMGLESLRELVREHPALGAEAVYDTATTSAQDGMPVAECVFHATAAAPAKSKKKQPVSSVIKVVLTEHGRNWEVDRLNVE